MAITVTETGSIILHVNQGAPGTVTTDGVQALSNKELINPVVSGGLIEDPYTANSGAAFTIDLSNGCCQIITLTANCTYTFPAPEPGLGFTLIQKQDATGGRTTTFPANVLLQTFLPMDLGASIDLMRFVSDGTDWYCSVIGTGY